MADSDGVLPRSKPRRGARRPRTNVASLFGAAIPIPQVNADVVEELERLSAAARDGRIAGLAYVKISPEGHFVTAWVGNADAHNMIAGAAILAHRITRVGGGDA